MLNGQEEVELNELIEAAKKLAPEIRAKFVAKILGVPEDTINSKQRSTFNFGGINSESTNIQIIIQSLDKPEAIVEIIDVATRHLKDVIKQ